MHRGERSAPAVLTFEWQLCAVIIKRTKAKWYIQSIVMLKKSLEAINWSGKYIESAGVCNLVSGSLNF